MRNDYQLFQQAGGGVAVVTQGTVAQTAEFRRRHELPFACLADPDRNAYRAFGLERGSLGQIAGPKIWLRSMRALFRGGAGAPQGDVRQMPGAFVVDRLGIVRLAHYSGDSGDMPPNRQVVACIGSLTQPEGSAQP